MPQVVAGRPNPARASAFQQLRARHGFTEWALASAASGFRVGWLREKVFAQEAQVLGARAFDAANRWMLGQRGRPRFKGKGRGLHSLAGKDRNGALRIAADGGGLQWGTGLVLPFVFDERNPYQWWAAWHVAEGRLRSCRIVRTRIRGRWVYVAQLVLDGKPLQRYQVSEGVVGLDVGPSAIAVVTDQGAWKETFCAELDDKARQLRRLQRRLDRQHRAGSPTCFDQQGRHQQGGCVWRSRSRLHGRLSGPGQRSRSCTGASPSTANRCTATSPTASSARVRPSTPRSCPTARSSVASGAAWAAGHRACSSPRCPARLQAPAGRWR
jgi:hypothetical protein